MEGKLDEGDIVVAKPLVSCVYLVSIPLWAQNRHAIHYRRQRNEAHPCFLTWNSLSAGIWTLAVGTVGFVFDQTVQVMLEDAKKYELWVLLSVFLIGIAIWTAHLLKKRPAKVVSIHEQ